jgi:hypothetical protein
MLADEEYDEEYTVTIARTIEEVEGMRLHWKKMQWHPNADIDYYLAVIKSRKEVERPHVLVLRTNDTPKAILVGRIENSQLPLSFGYKTLARPRVRTLAVVYGGTLGHVSPSYSRILLSELMKSLRNGVAELIFFNNLRIDSDFYKLAIKARGVWHRNDRPEESLHWRTSPFTTYDDFYEARTQNTRHNLRRYSKKLEKEFGLELTVKRFLEPGDLAAIMADIEKVARKSYHRGMAAGFIDSPEMQQRVSFALEKHWFRGWVLYIRNNPCAFWTGIRYGNTFFTETTGYDPQYERSHPGTYLFVKMMEDLYLEGVNVVDFGFGDAQYKRNYCEEHWKEAAVYIFAPTLKGVSIDLAKTACGFGERVGQSLLKRMDILMKVKKHWRRRLTKTGNVSQGDLEPK